MFVGLTRRYSREAKGAAAAREAELGNSVGGFTRGTIEGPQSNFVQPDRASSTAVAELFVGREGLAGSACRCPWN